MKSGATLSFGLSSIRLLWYKWGSEELEWIDTCFFFCM